MAALLVAAHLHAGDVDPVLAEDPAQLADDARTVVVAEESQVLGRLQVDVVAVDLHELLDVLRAGHRSADRQLAAVGEAAADGHEIAVVGAHADRR